MSFSPADRMSREELRAGASLAAIFALRMLGLFLILPVFAIHARDLPGGDDLSLVGIALGIYGLTQAMFQIPFGAASDRYGRKRVIVLGLLLFAVGSFVAAAASDIYITILGRVLQGAGAISAAVTALAADLTREQHRTKVMAMIGSSIGLMFAISLVGAPLLYDLIGMAGIFALTGLLALGGIVLVQRVVPQPPVVPPPPHGAWREVLWHGELLRLNFGIFVLHVVQMAMFVVVPGALVNAGLDVDEHWKVYLPAVLASFVLLVPAIMFGERRGKMKRIFIVSIVLLLATQLGLPWLDGTVLGLALALLAFFVAFNVLEASLPSLVSRVAPSHAKGMALGVYNTTQAFGLFLGGAVGGMLAQHSGSHAVHWFGAALAVVWLAVAAGMRVPPVLARREFALPEGCDAEALRRQLADVQGVSEAVVTDGIAHLKVNLARWDEGRVRQLIGGQA